MHYLRLVLGPAVIVGALALLPPVASAATCDDYSTQAAAQAAKDTRDADGDGLYCEENPCPCSTGSGGGGSSTSEDAAAERRREREAARKRAAARRRAAKRRAAAQDRRRRLQINEADAKLVEVVDGDTVKVYLSDLGRRETVRLLGIDTPETTKPGVSVECGGREATHTLLALGFASAADTDGDGLFDTEGDGQGVRVVLTTDPTQELRDRYGRLLAYVDVPEGTPLLGSTSYELSESLLVTGWATTYDFEENGQLRRLGRYERAERDAAENGAGVWTACDGDFHSER